MTLNADDNRRQAPRFIIECPVSFSRFNSDQHHRAVVKNYSREGMYIEARYPIKPGTQILIQRESCSTPFDCAVCNTLNAMVMAEVKWTRDLRESEGAGCGFGVKYTL